MRINKQELTKAACLLKLAGGHEQVRNLLENLIKENQDPCGELDVIDRNAYIATIIWQTEDLESALLKNGTEPTPENVKKLRNALNAKYLQEAGIEAGWDVIGSAIADANL